ncbi:hypothetical protein ACMCNP_04475 [Candidatus Acidulodesulfobacterium sp. H_13]
MSGKDTLQDRMPGMKMRGFLQGATVYGFNQSRKRKTGFVLGKRKIV